MFDTPEYVSYIALCRELRLERRWQAGDWAVYAENPEPVCITGAFPYAQPPWTWLPRLDQWLTMLEEAGWTDLGLYGEDGHYGLGLDGHSFHDGLAQMHDGPTREEAAARLWMAVTGRTVTSG